MGKRYDGNYDNDECCGLEESMEKERRLFRHGVKELHKGIRDVEKAHILEGIIDIKEGICDIEETIEGIFDCNHDIF